MIAFTKYAMFFVLLELLRNDHEKVESTAINNAKCIYRNECEIPKKVNIPILY